MGKHLSDESCRKLSMVNMGHPVSEETRRKIGDAHRGNLSSNYGKSKSEETRLKLSLALKAYWRNAQLDSGTAEKEKSK